MAAEDVTNLRQAVMRYKTIDDQIRELNKQAYSLREERNIAALEITDIIRQPAYAAYTKLDIPEDGSRIKIIKPGWTSEWSLSTTKLYQYIIQYFASTSAPSASDCYLYICDVNWKSLRKNEYLIERLVRKVQE